jgi:predicted alpha/beta-hydrolase family hydrolase
MFTLKLLICITSLFLASQAARADGLTVIGSDGAQLSIVADFPAGEGKYPTIVLAPGQGYHMALPAMEAVARSFNEQGIAVFRFNWAYFTRVPKGQPSNDLSTELQDLRAVLEVARKHPKVDTKNLSVGGKSLGSLVAWRALATDSQLRSALLLTPICSRLQKGETEPRSEALQNYPSVDSERRPTLWISGNSDPLCTSSILYRLAETSKGSARVAIVAGDHSFENHSLSTTDALPAHTKNLAAVSLLSANFIAEISRTIP